MREHRIAVIHGDGIGPELVDAALTVLDAVVDLDGAFRLRTRFVEAGARAYLETGTSMSAESLAVCAQSDAILKGPVGLPEARRPDGTEAGLLGGALRGTLDLYANVRPVTMWPGVVTRMRHERLVDYVIVRENTEGLYASRGLGVSNRWAAADTLLMTRPAVERIVRYAFDLAMRRGRVTPERRPYVTCVDKANVLKSFAFFRAIFDEVSREHPDIGADHMHTDAAAQALVLEPERFDVLVMENFVGDLLSELGAATVGGVGLCASGNYGERLAYFEPVHGSAPALAGRNLANPISQVLAAAMLLDHLGERSAATRIRRATRDVLADGRLRLAADGTVPAGTRTATDVIVAALRVS